MSRPTLYRVSFINHGKLLELYAGRVASSDLYGFIELSDLVFDSGDSVVVDPTEERLRDEFGQTEVLHLPMHAVMRVEVVRRRQPSRIRDAATGDKVTMFPLPARPPASRDD